MNWVGKFRVESVEPENAGRVVHLSAVPSGPRQYEQYTPYGTYHGTTEGDSPDGVNVGAIVTIHVTNPLAFPEVDALRPGDAFCLSVNEWPSLVSGSPSP